MTSLRDPGTAGQPPQPPEIDRGFKFVPSQMVGVLLFLAVVISAAFGAFGPSQQSTTAQAGPLDVRIEQPARFRYKQIDPLTILVTNRGRSALDTVRASIDTAYMRAFSNVKSTPSASEPWLIELVDVAPGQTRRIDFELQAELYGRHRGALTISAAGDSARVPLMTFIWP